VAQSGEELWGTIRTRVSRGPDRRQERALITARLRMVAQRDDGGLADLRWLAEGRGPRARLL